MSDTEKSSAYINMQSKRWAAFGYTHQIPTARPWRKPVPCSISLVPWWKPSSAASANSSASLVEWWGLSVERRELSPPPGTVPCSQLQLAARACSRPDGFFTGQPSLQPQWCIGRWAAAWHPLLTHNVSNKNGNGVAHVWEQLRKYSAKFLWKKTLARLTM